SHSETNIVCRLLLEKKKELAAVGSDLDEYHVGFRRRVEEEGAIGGDAHCPGVVQVIQSNPISGVVSLAENFSRSFRNCHVTTLAGQRPLLDEEVVGSVIEGETNVDVNIDRNSLSGELDTGRIHCDGIPGAHTIVGDERDAPV